MEARSRHKVRTFSSIVSAPSGNSSLLIPHSSSPLTNDSTKASLGHMDRTMEGPSEPGREGKIHVNVYKILGKVQVLPTYVLNLGSY